jgi:hypothetical protein
MALLCKMQFMNKSQYQEFSSLGVLDGGEMANRNGYGARCAPYEKLFKTVPHGFLAHAKNHEKLL